MWAPNKKQQHRDSSEWQTPEKNPKNVQSIRWCHTDTPRHSMQELAQPVRKSELSKGTLIQEYGEYVNIGILEYVEHTPVCLQRFMQVSEYHGEQQLGNVRYKRKLAIFMMKKKRKFQSLGLKYLILLCVIGFT